MSPLDLSIFGYIRLVSYMLATAWSIAALGYLISLSVKGSTVLAFYFVVVRTLPIPAAASSLINPAIVLSGNPSQCSWHRSPVDGTKRI